VCVALSCVCCACCLQLDKAAADASEYKAGYDKVLADTWEQKAQVGATST
jgi:hypothetical protein